MKYEEKFGEQLKLPLGAGIGVDPRSALSSRTKPRRRQSGIAVRDLLFSLPQPVTRYKSPISIRQYFQVEIAVILSKQTIGAPAIRQFFGGACGLGSASTSENKRQAKPDDLLRKSFKTNDRDTKQVSIFCDVCERPFSNFNFREK